MVERDSASDADPLETAYLELLAGREQGWEEFRRDRPELAAALDRLQRDPKVGEGAPPVSPSFCDRLASLYGEETREDWTTADDSSAEPNVSVADDIGAPRYRVLSEVARGGMGIVFEVLDTDLDRVLAMKVIQEQFGQRSAGTTTATSASLLRRFLREAKITAQLDHPGVVPVYDVGIHHDGCVYFTMRLVPGEDLRDIMIANREGKNDWTTSRVVDVLLKVCDTVAFCHDRGVIHRDLKPANIRVGRYGEVYVMDWGLARVLGTVEKPETTIAPLDADGLRTLEGQVLGTPAYMAPEQAKGSLDEVGVASDVYSLGAMLYTLLAGAPPYFEDHETPRTSGVLTSLEAGPPRSLREKAGNASSRLIEICERAMARRAEDRYASVMELANALRDQREDERRALRDLELLRADADRSRRVSSFLVDLFGALDPSEGHGGTITVETLLERGDRRLASDFGDDPMVRASIERALGRINRELGRFDDALRLLEQALASERAAPLTDELEEAETLHALGSLHAHGERLSQAKSSFEEALERRMTRLGDRDERVAATQQELAIVLLQMGNPVAAEALGRNALAIREALCADDDPELGLSYHHLGFLLAAAGKTTEAIGYFRRALELWEACHGDHMTTASCLNNLSRSLADEGLHDEAREMMERALAMRRRLLAGDHPSIASTLQNLATHDYDLGRHRSCVNRSREALAIRRTHFPEDHPDVCVSKSILGNALGAVGELEEAERLQREVLEVRDRTLDPGHRGHAITRHNYAAVLARAGKLEEAEKYSRLALEHRRANLTARHPEVATNLAALGMILLDRFRADGGEERLREAGSLIEEALAIRRESFAEEHAAVAASLHALGSWEAARGEVAAAQEAFEAAIVRRRALRQHVATGESLLALAELLWLDHRERAMSLAADAVTELSEELADDHPSVVRARTIAEAT